MALSQSRLESLIETGANIASGFIVSLLLWSYVVAPLYGITMRPMGNLGVVSIFTVSAIIRSYIWRRWFNARLHRRLEELFNERES